MNESIEYQPRLEISPERLALYRKDILTALQPITEQINESVGTKLLADDGTVSRKNYGFSKEILKKHEKITRDNEDRYIRKQLGLDYAAPVSAEHRKKYEELSANPVSELMELSLIILFKRIFKDKYVPCRCAKFDDQKGNDTMIVNRETGDVICSFDDVHDTTENELLDWRKDRLNAITNQKGGATITYGFTFENGNLVKKEIKNVPKFHIKFDFRQLITLLSKMKFDLDSPLQPVEIETYNNIIEMFDGQLETNKREGSEHPEYLKNLDAFENLLPELRSFGQQEYRQAA